MSTENDNRGFETGKRGDMTNIIWGYQEKLPRALAFQPVSQEEKASSGGRGR